MLGLPFFLFYSSSYLINVDFWNSLLFFIFILLSFILLNWSTGVDFLDSIRLAGLPRYAPTSLRTNLLVSLKLGVIFFDFRRLEILAIRRAPPGGPCFDSRLLNSALQLF